MILIRESLLWSSANRLWRLQSNGFAMSCLIDTAGRLHIDEELMQELSSIKNTVQSRIKFLFVADAMTGQDAVNQAIGFDGKLGLTGIILTKLDGDARGGAALSIRPDGWQADSLFRRGREA